MKMNRLATVSVLALATLTSRQAAHSLDFTAKVPDLNFQSIAKVGSTADVMVRNTGTGAATASILRVERWNGAAWVLVTTRNIPVLQAGQTLPLSISHNALFGHTCRYILDSTNVVNESNEANNLGYDTLIPG